MLYCNFSCSRVAVRLQLQASACACRSLFFFSFCTIESVFSSKALFLSFREDVRGTAFIQLPACHLQSCIDPPPRNFLPHRSPCTKKKRKLDCLHVFSLFFFFCDERHLVASTVSPCTPSSRSQRTYGPFFCIEARAHAFVCMLDLTSCSSLVPLLLQRAHC